MTEERGPFYPEIVGPFLPEHFVTINGYKVPYVTVTPTSDGRIAVYVDRRFGLDEPVSVEEFNRWIGILADAMSVAAGYSSHGEHCSPINPHKVKMGALGSVAPVLNVIDGGKPNDPEKR
jgi:hypothetical protein